MASFFVPHCPRLGLLIHFRHSWGYYAYVLQKKAVDDASIKALRHTILKENNASTDEDECDGGLQNEVCLHARLTGRMHGKLITLIRELLNHVNVLLEHHSPGSPCHRGPRDWLKVVAYAMHEIMYGCTELRAIIPTWNYRRQKIIQYWNSNSANSQQTARAMHLTMQYINMLLIFSDVCWSK